MHKTRKNKSWIFVWIMPTLPMAISFYIQSKRSRPECKYRIKPVIIRKYGGFPFFIRFEIWMKKKRSQ